ncbi:hypothetical protein ACL02T_15895 [Pseudonocardia sp. RS010]|uniref:hypothetical protein n=1 Tax=Pseudonocardia sp. RS010 TaxID=3385979 RepID=UPI0039A2531C
MTTETTRSVPPDDLLTAVVAWPRPSRSVQRIALVNNQTVLNHIAERSLGLPRSY